MNNLSSYLPIVKFMSDFLGAEAEVLLCDAEKKQVIYVENPLCSETKIGSEIGDLEQKFIDQNIHKEKDFIGNYRAFSKERKKLRSSTLFIKDDLGELKGLITINFNVDQYLELRGLIDKIINGNSKNAVLTGEKNFYESYNMSFEDMMNSTISEALKKFDVSPERLSYDEKMELIKILDEKGTFLIKGSVAELARALNTTETTIYRYINKLD